MITLTPQEAAAALGIREFHCAVVGVSVDSRNIDRGDLFVALKGERFDGHDFVGDALAAGACAAVVNAAWLSIGGDAAAATPIAEKTGRRIYPVADTLEVLGSLARAVRRKSGVLVIAVTGSVGKTGTKDILGMMASRVGAVVVTLANQNNEIGVPLTLLRLEASTKTAVVEMGMRGAGQIAALAAIAEPDVGVITNIHPVHLELLGSLEDVAKAKVEIITGLKAGGVGVVPANCELLKSDLEGLGRRIVRFGVEDEGGRGSGGRADVRGRYQRHHGGRRATLSLKWPGGASRIETPFGARAKIENTVAAAAGCYAGGLPVEECLRGLGTATLTASRGDIEYIGDWIVLDDTYNANPAAVRGALDELVKIAADEGGRPVAVLGDMLELGSASVQYHKAIGVYAAEKGIQVLWGVGPLSRSTTEGYESAAGPMCAAGHLDNSAEIDPLLVNLQPGDVILFKASRSIKLEIMVDLLRKVAARGCSA
ncbi:MAG: UDP-N-acetylmuramoyl-tripeptide--D-alanyl-D-alanine ligase [Actinobacteria bacterium]|nr:UDP-N-acetylmuramoyl-tripeptide--D-alanyl-D-alanine ligase [Actinomycetota bacterium]